MSDNAQAETRQFQAEAKQLLHLMTHSLYSSREIFLRELISNASDACDKLRFESLENPGLAGDGLDLRVRIELDEKAGTISVTDNGIGMNRQEVIENIGTIASSGTAKFLQNLTGDQKKDSALIGQFGVGFYSSFIVADRVDVYSRRAGDPAENGVHWSCSGEAEYQIEACELAEHGTAVVLHLKKDAREFLEAYRVKSIIRKYSEHIDLPVQMWEEKDEEEGQFETVNSAVALWTRPRNEISDDEYRAFYKQLSHDYEDPLLWSHNKVEGKLDYTSLLFIPSRATQDLWRREAARGLKLYIRRTFILDDAEQFLPMYLRFVKGVIDSNDLPLNVSRELLQDSPQVQRIRSALTKRVIDLLAKTAKKDQETYQKFWDAFGAVFKEGIVEEPESQEKLVELLRFATTSSQGSQQDQSLADYVERMPEGQDKIYYLTGESHSILAKSPLLESCRKSGREVLLLSDGIDEWLMAHLSQYGDYAFQDLARGDLDESSTEESDNQSDSDEKPRPEILQRVEKVLEDRVAEVRHSSRLVDSASCLVLNAFDMGAQMRRLMEASGQQVPETKPVLEINLEHPLVKKMQSATGSDFDELSEILFDQARLANGEAPTDPVAYLQRINKFLTQSI